MTYSYKYFIFCLSYSFLWNVSTCSFNSLQVILQLFPAVFFLLILDAKVFILLTKTFLFFFSCKCVKWSGKCQVMYNKIIWRCADPMWECYQPRSSHMSTSTLEQWMADHLLTFYSDFTLKTSSSSSSLYISFQILKFLTFELLCFLPILLTTHSICYYLLWLTLSIFDFLHWFLHFVLYRSFIENLFCFITNMVPIKENDEIMYKSVILPRISAMSVCSA